MLDTRVIPDPSQTLHYIEVMFMLVVLRTSSDILSLTVVKFATVDIKSTPNSVEILCVDPLA